VKLRFALPGLIGCGALLAGCYTLTPASGGAPEVGTKVAFDINDAGRVALGSSMGQEIAQVEGTLVEKDATGYLLAVSNVRLLRGGEQVWTGEQVRLRQEYLGNTYERRLSMGRSVGMGVIGVGGFAALVATRSLVGGGSKNDGLPDDSANTRLGRP
jgi:hypothetical protein